MQRLEARLTTSLITRNNSPGLQGSSTMPVTYQSIFKGKERLTVVINAAETATESARTNHSPLLRWLLLKLLSVFAAPFGYFETLSSFRPEAYAVYDIGPQTVCYSLVLEKKNPKFATFTQDLFVAKTQRHWVRIKLRMTVVVGTAQWKVVAEHTPKHPSYIGWHQLPRNVISLLQNVMAEHPDVSDDAEITMGFDKNSDATVHDGNPKAISLTRMLSTSIIDSTWNYIESLRHRNVPMIPETALVAAYLHGNTLVAYLNDRWVLYRIATAGNLGIDFLWRGIQAHIALRGASHVAQLVGVIVDSERRLLKGILVELPSKGPMFRLMKVYRSKGKPIPWPVRQKWAKQIVRGVAALHERGQVIGGIRTYNWCVSINEHDDAMIVALPNGRHPAVHGQDGMLPPEYRTEAFENGDGQVGPEFDVFQLGGLLWHLYRYQHQQGSRTFCSLVGCNNAKLNTCDEHGNPVALPKAAVDIPDYLDRVIALCRQENPRKRPAAWELVHIFPTDEEIFRQIDLLSTDEHVISEDRSAAAANAKLARLEVVRDMYGFTLICTLCREQSHDVYYSCEVCDLGNYDLCHKCFVQGEHCWDRTHLLSKLPIEALRNKDLVQRLPYYSSVGEDGKREEIVI